MRALIHRDLTDEDARKLAFIKNVVRRNLSPMDRANAIYQAQQHGMKAAEIASEFGLSAKQLKRYEALLKFSKAVQAALERGTIAMAHARVLAEYRPKDVDEWVKRTHENGLSAKRLRRELRKAFGAKTRGKRRLYVKKGKTSLRVFPFTISKETPKSERERVERLLTVVREIVKGWE